MLGQKENEFHYHPFKDESYLRKLIKQLPTEMTTAQNSLQLPSFLEQNIKASRLTPNYI